ESGQRGDPVPGVAASVEAYAAAAAGLASEVERLRQLPSDNVTQQERLRLLEGQVHRKLPELEATIVARKAGDTAAAGQIVAGGAGQQATDRVREGIDDERGAKRRRHADRHRSAHAAYRAPPPVESVAM